jgi:hypothetical protein
MWARSLLGAVLTLLAGCASATPKLAPAPRASAPVAAALHDVPIQRDLYTHKLVYLLRHGWRTPAQLDAPPMSLNTVVELAIDAHGQLMRYRLAQSSGNASFDSSVADHLQALIDSGARAEHGPPYIVDRVFGELITVLFRGPPPPGTPPY